MTHNTSGSFRVDYLYVFVTVTLNTTPGSFKVDCTYLQQWQHNTRLLQGGLSLRICNNDTTPAAIKLDNTRRADLAPLISRRQRCLHVFSCPANMPVIYLHLLSTSKVPGLCFRLHCNLRLCPEVNMILQFVTEGFPFLRISVKDSALLWRGFFCTRICLLSKNESRLIKSSVCLRVPHE
jgi:hypothetical protein